ncbi:class I SAM-dependent RNA methyltransferase [Roseicyclus mahoneyensis]|uniref:23S rRNA m(5)U-1939 methyltransferase n=1 Tax=Roseicyclus mahoneyensis TaxID=164332 RepID=A0A316GIW9_9RHOB|nr:class I SAM-dependent RNA methyltransferase [Roseicyclus mahoneyensis]PWK59922.1 23S rRNA m(5)U-1939 methyltransferase [Roseicyclus mahoneyensis]
MTDTQLTIHRLGHQGDGIAPGPVFVPLTLPGELVEGVVEGDRMETPRIVTPSSDRVRAPCAHYRSCGGCSLMHAADPFVAAWKAQVIETALAAHDLATDIRPTLTSPPRSRRRATLAGRRTKKGALVGFHGRRSDVIVPLTECHVLAPALVALIPTLAEITQIGGSRSATLSFALTLTDTGVDCAVTGGKPLDGPLQATLPRFRDKIARLTWGDEPVYADHAPTLRFGPVTIAPPPGAFLQATPEGEAALRAAVTAALEGSTRIADLFAGCGTFALPLATHTPVHAVEGDETLTGALLLAARHAQGLKSVTAETRDLFRRPLLPEELARFDGIVIDPPRAGAEAQTRALAEAQVARIATVSCNPVTFARDAALLVQAGYRLNWVQPVDQFRWSPHVELAASLSLPHLSGN